MDRAVVGSRRSQHADAITTWLPNVETQHDGTVAFCSDEELFTLAPERRSKIVHRLHRRLDRFPSCDRHPLGLEAHKRLFRVRRPLFEPDRIVRISANVSVRNDTGTAGPPIGAVTISEEEDASPRP